jgi:hypothetical protein
MASTDEQVDEYVEDSIELLETAQVELEKKYGIARFERWDLYQDRGQLVFSDDTGVVLTCNVCAIGTYANGKWLWAWAN